MPSQTSLDLDIERDRRRLEQLSFLSIETMRDMVVWVTEDGRIAYANASAQAHFARCVPRLSNPRIYEIVPFLNEESWRVHWQEILDGKVSRFETEHRLSETETLPIEVSVNLIEHNGTLYNCAVFHDISERKRLEAELLQANATLERLVLTDALTGIANRREFERRIATEWATHRRTGVPLSLVMIDVDLFKDFNDTYGHPEGDECLKRVAQSLKHCIRRETDLVARIGGEEFACLLPGTDLAGALKVATSIRDSVMAERIPHRASRVAPVVTVSVGVVTSSQAAEFDAHMLINAADRCLYEAKEAGRNRVSCRPLDKDAVEAAASIMVHPETDDETQEDEALLRAS